MIVPSDYKILCRISFGKHESYQIIKLCNFINLTSRLPSNSRIDILSYLPNFTYGWSSIEEIESCPVSIHKGMTSIRNLFFEIPSSVRLVRPAIIPENFFEIRPVNEIEYFSNLVLIDNVKEYFIDTKYATKVRRKSVDLNEYVRKEYIKHTDSKIYLNGREFATNYFMKEQDNIYFDYLSAFFIELTSIYRYHIMLSHGYLTSLVLRGDHKKVSTLIKENELIVPANTYWMSQLLFARNTSVKVLFANNEKFDFATEKLKIRKIYAKVDGVNLSISNKGATPVFINGGAAMRFIE